MYSPHAQKTERQQIKDLEEKKCEKLLALPEVFPLFYLLSRILRTKKHFFIVVFHLLKQSSPSRLFWTAFLCYIATCLSAITCKQSLKWI